MKKASGIIYLIGSIIELTSIPIAIIFAVYFLVNIDAIAQGAYEMAVADGSIGSLTQEQYILAASYIVNMWVTIIFYGVAGALTVGILGIFGFAGKLNKGGHIACIIVGALTFCTFHIVAAILGLIGLNKQDKPRELEVAIEQARNNNNTIE